MPKYTLDLGEKFDKVLGDLAAERGTTKSDILRRAVASYKYLIEQTTPVGLKVSITDLNDRVIKDVTLP